MKKNHLAYTMLMAACGLVIVSGCSSGKTTSPRKTPQDKSPELGVKTESPKGRSTAAKEPVKITIPSAKLSAEDSATCLIRLGDAMPEAVLPDLQGRAQSLGQLYGKRLTFVCFWTAGDSPKASLKAREMLESLALDLAEPFAGQGVAVVAIDVGDSPETAAKLAGEAGAKYPVLLDQDGRYFAKVAAKILPRVYLLDAEGKVIWFDIEYSGSFIRRNVVPAITDLLKM
jgi:thiol-disulfide isomerase/thioredoxin